MSFVQRLAYSAQTEVTYGLDLRELTKPGALQYFSSYALLWSIGGPVCVLLTILTNGFGVLFVQPVLVICLLVSVFATITLAMLRPHINREFPRELALWVIKHQWFHAGAIFLSGALLLRTLFL